MIEVYSNNIDVAQDAAIVWNNVNIKKGCTAELSAPATINLNKCGVYMVECNADPTASTTIQLFKDGVAVPQTESTGVSPAFATLVQVSHDNSCACCASPTTLQVRNMGTADATFTAVNLVVTKIC